MKISRLSIPSLLTSIALLVSCSSSPPQPDWQMNAQSSMQRSTEAYLAGNARVEAQEFARARSEIARTGRADLLARLALMHCAGRVASLVDEACAGFEKLRVDAAAPERAYADFLAGKRQLADLELLPTQHRATASAVGDSNITQALQNIIEPQSRLVSAGVLFRQGRANPAVIALAVETASAQGWRRPLLAWLGVQRLMAEKAGDSDEAARISRRMALVENVAAPKP